MKNNSDYVRNALVMGSIGEYSEYDYLSKILKDALERGQGKSTLKGKLSEIKRNGQGKSYKTSKKQKER